MKSSEPGEPLPPDDLPSKPRRALVVGCGGICKAWIDPCLTHFSERVEIVGFVDLRREAAESFAVQCGKVWSGTSLARALQEVKPDLVFNCTVPEAHATVCAEALRAGCHVLTEKPLAPNLRDAAEMVCVAAECNRVLAVIQNRRYHGNARRVGNALSNGAIGRLHTINADFFIAPHFGGFREEMLHVLLVDMAIHTFDAARYLSGKDPLSVYAHEFNPPGSWYSHGASAHAIFEMTEETVFNYRGSWCATGHATEWNSNWRFIGDRGTLLWDGENDIRGEIADPDWAGSELVAPTVPVKIPDWPMAPEEFGHAGNIKEFLDCLDNQTEPRTIASDNIKSLAMVECAVRSAETGQKLAVSW